MRDGAPRKRRPRRLAEDGAMSAMPVKRVVVVMAMLAEARPLLSTLGYEEGAEPKRVLVGGSGPGGGIGHVYEGKIGGLEVAVVVNGKCGTFGCDAVGKVPAALVTHAAITDLKPDVLINAGTCGGFKAKGCDIGDVFVVSGHRVHDARIPLPVLQEYGVGSWPANPAPRLVEHLGAKSEVLTTGDSLDCPENDAATIRANGAAIKDMEGSAIAYTANLHGVPLIGIKAVTDIVDGSKPTTEEFLENLHKAAGALMENLRKALSYLDGKSVGDLA